TLFSKLVHFTRPYMRFLFVGPRVCLQLLSVEPHGFPFAFAYSSYCQAWSGHFTALDNAHAGHTKKSPQRPQWHPGAFLIVISGMILRRQRFARITHALPKAIQIELP
ncbi:MAG: hypothetical protein LBT47_01555, partial [Deltaproteobacteria bacterium]|nr:hypothetical protein [Deltaproteobacteria bacterium]